MEVNEQSLSLQWKDKVHPGKAVLFLQYTQQMLVHIFFFFFNTLKNSYSTLAGQRAHVYLIISFTLGLDMAQFLIHRKLSLIRE